MLEKNKKNKMESEYAFIKPFVYKKASITNISVRMLILLSVQIALLFFTKSHDALLVIGATFLGSLLAFSIRFFVSKEPVYSLFEVILQGVMFGMLLPETYPPLPAMFLSFVLFFVVKYVFSNSYNVWVNVVALGVVVAWFIGKKFFPPFLLSADLIGEKNPSLLLIQKGVFPISSFDSTVTSFLNGKFFKYLGVTVPNGYVSLLWDSHSIFPAFRFNLITLLSSLFLFSDDGVEIFVPSVFMFVYVVLVRLFAPVFYGGSFNSGDIILTVFSSGTLFCSVFLLQWFGTMPGSLFGKTVYSVLTGILAFLIVGLGTSSIGMVYTILISNVITVVIKMFEDNKNLSILKKIISEKDGVYSK